MNTEHTKKNPKTAQYTGFEIAVIGMAGYFPGASDIRSFWQNLKNGIESIRYFSDEELREAGVEQEIIDHPAYVKACRVIENKAYFDSSFFGYIPQEARILEPQTRLFHQTAWEALEDAGYDPDSFTGLIGLYAGAGDNSTWVTEGIFADLLQGYAESSTSNPVDAFTARQYRTRDYIASRISYKLNLKGPAVFVHTACSTSLVAIHMACRGLLTGEANIALAGGVSFATTSPTGYLYSEGLISSPDGRCLPFDADSAGTVTGEGSAAVVLKQLKRALADRDNIRAVIKGTAINNDGLRKVGFSAPSIDGQADVIRMAFKLARLKPSDIGYIETHGTATRLGDPIEAGALKDVFGESHRKYCALGAVKSNIGHLDTAAGVAGFIKTVLALEHKQIPPSLYFNKLNTEIDFKNTPFYLNTELQEWKATEPGGLLRGGVSSFGIGGTNAHVLLEEAPSIETSPPVREEQLIIFSARNQEALERMRKRMLEYFQDQEALPTASPFKHHIADVAYTLQTGRRFFSQRNMFICRDAQEAIEILSSPKLEKVKKYTVEKKRKPIVFMFPGQGTQYVAMGREMYEKEKLFREEMDRCFEITRALLDFDLKEILYPGHHSSSIPHHSSYTIDHPEVMPVAIFIFSYALAKLLLGWGIEPAMLIGYSFGEYVAACISGVFTLEDALKLVVLRGRLMAKLPEGAMLSVPLPANQIKGYIAAHHGIALAIDNGPSCIVSGTTEAVATFEQEMKQKKLLCLPVGLGIAFHSPNLDALVKDFAAAVADVSRQQPVIPYISSVTGTWIRNQEAMDPTYWADHMRLPVRFAKGLEEILKDENILLIEVGPGKSLSNTMMQHPHRKPGQFAVNLVRTKDERKTDMLYLLERIGRLWLYGASIDWRKLTASENRKKVSLPSYPFEKIKYPMDLTVMNALKDVITSQLQETGNSSRHGMDMERLFASIQVENTHGSGEAIQGSNLRPEVVTHYIAPSTPTEKTLVDIWQSFFASGKIGVIDDFFEIGGDSLKAMNLSGQIHRQLDVEIGLPDFFNRPTIRDLAQYIDHAAKTSLTLISRAEKREYYPLSSSQSRLYFLQQLVPGSLAYNLPQSLPLQQELDIQRVEQTIKQRG